MAIDGGCRGKASAGLGTLVNIIFPPRRLPTTQKARPQRHASSYAPNRQIASNCRFIFADNLYLASLKRNRRMMSDVQKSALRRCASRSSSPVHSPVASIVTATEASDGFAGSKTGDPRVPREILPSKQPSTGENRRHTSIHPTATGELRH